MSYPTGRRWPASVETRYKECVVVYVYTVTMTIFLHYMKCFFLFNVKMLYEVYVY